MFASSNGTSDSMTTSLSTRFSIAIEGTAFRFKFRYRFCGVSKHMDFSKCFPHIRDLLVGLNPLGQISIHCCNLSGSFRGNLFLCIIMM